VAHHGKTVPLRLKPINLAGSYGTAEQFAEKLIFVANPAEAGAKEPVGELGRTADLSTTLRFGRDDKSAKCLEIKVATNLSPRPKRSVVGRSAVSGCFIDTAFKFSHTL
jgi:hypothetical protein